MKRSLVSLALLAALMLPASAQEWPKPTTTIVVGLGPGSGLDLIARIFAKGMQKRLGTTFVVENKPGAGGNLAVATVARAAPDGSTMVLGHSGNVLINPMMMDVGCDPMQCLAPVSILATTPSIFVANKKLGVKSLGELVQLLKSHPGKYTYGTLGPGSSSDLAYEVIASETGAKVVRVPYRSTPEMVRAVTAGEVDFTMPVLAAAESSVKADMLVPLAISSAKRWPSLPGVPTTGEAGFPSIPIDVWNGLLVPADTPKEVIAKIVAAIQTVAKDPEAQAQIRRLSYRPEGSTSEAFAKQLHTEKILLSGIMKSAGLVRNQ